MWLQETEAGGSPDHSELGGTLFRCFPNHLLGRLHHPGCGLLLFQHRSVSLLSISYISFLKNFPLEKIGPTLSKISHPLMLVQPTHFINNENEVQRGGGHDFPRSYGQLVSKLRWEVKSPDLGCVPSTGSLLIIFWGCVSGHPSWAVGSWREGRGLRHF